MCKKFFKLITAAILSAGLLSACSAGGSAPAEVPPQTESAAEKDASGFVSLAEAVPDVILEIRYYSEYNFVGDRIDGYEEPYPDTYFDFPVSEDSVPAA